MLQHEVVDLEFESKKLESKKLKKANGMESMDDSKIPKKSTWRVGQDELYVTSENDLTSTNSNNTTSDQDELFASLDDCT